MPADNSTALPPGPWHTLPGKRDCDIEDVNNRLVAAHCSPAAAALLAGIPVVGYEEMERERDTARALLAELAAAVRARDEAWATYDYWGKEPQKAYEESAVRVQDLLRRAEAEAGVEVRDEK